MQQSLKNPSFRVVTGRAAYETIFSSVERVIEIVAAAYRAHAAGRTINPDSYFLRFPGRDRDRIIALPAHLDDCEGHSASGIKWISSFPGNIAHGLPRASAVLVLNDPETGYPIACLEASVISAARTAASAVLGASWLNGKRHVAQSLGVVGTGLISRYIIEFFLRSGWQFEELHLYDADIASSALFSKRFQDKFSGGVHFHDGASAVVRSSMVVVFATTSASPYVDSVSSFSHNPLVLHISLRDLSPGIIFQSHNVVDDVDHCLKAGTSLHLTEQMTKSRDFVQFTLPDILSGAPMPDRSRPIIFSPFGMGILDIAVGAYVLETAIASGHALDIPEFFYDLVRV